jgi:GGDEF domain-containing protein
VRRRLTVLYYSSGDRPVPAPIDGWLEERELVVSRFREVGEMESVVLRNPPTLVLIDGEGDNGAGLSLCRDLKEDGYTAVAPVVVIAGDQTSDEVGTWFRAGADEVISSTFAPAEQTARLDGLLLRTERNVSVHPSTRLPGTNEIERAIRDRLERGESFAVCYADLDHFKEYNDRYSYRDGDRVIFLLSRILADVTRGICGRAGFVGHIGGDDFIMVLPLGCVHEVCGETIAVFDELISFQYSEQDRRAGYFFGRDRRGQLYRVPLMTLSIGVVTNEYRRFGHPARASELATEMKSYAKTLPGSVFVVDRRHDRDKPIQGG